MLDQAVFEQLAANKRRIVLACSGGVDSMVLLHMLRQTAVRQKLLVVHINHQLQPQASDWVEFVRQQCGDLPNKTITVTVHDLGQGLEASARQARYQAFEQLLGKDDVLLTAHHIDDQVETLFLRMLRGSSLAGLSGMQTWRQCGRGMLYRPLLSVTRETIVAYAQQYDIQWIEDPSNVDTQYDRNFLRQQVLPLIQQRWPQYQQTIERARQHIAVASETQREAWQTELEHRLTAQGALKVVNFDALAQADQLGLLACWLEFHDQLVPSQQYLMTLIEQLIDAGADRQPKMRLGNRDIRRFGSAIFLLPELNDAQWPQVALTPEQPLVVEKLGTLTLQPAQADGFRPVLSVNRLMVQTRQGGERITPPRRGGSRDVKRLLQEYREAPWWRERLPMLYVDGELAAVADLAIDEQFAAKTGEMGYLVQWQRPGEVELL
ncbi:tRNA lysidine(34) synthetase TilS [Salinibius halmophilus]|uniref:tRNA lysidine(34) synthetase TilS n=1 Tax=Salinibius halmophilus TaxID=1853216 RepID=UPI0013140B03|nr:tRNA lysidine(34) synthetase TilS [Salinibius halmophilus]